MKQLFFITTLMVTSFNSFALKQTRFKAKKYQVPRKEVSIIINKEGFYPDKFMAYAGEEIYFYVTSVKERPTCFMVKGKELFLPAKKGSISEGSVFFSKPGTYEFYCPSEKTKGKITIVEHPEIVREKKRRGIASENRVKVWTPRDD